MDFKWGQILEGTIALIFVYLLVANADNASGVLRAIGGVYADSVKALQGRG